MSGREMLTGTESIYNFVACIVAGVAILGGLLKKIRPKKHTKFFSSDIFYQQRHVLLVIHI